jgi:sphingomyelin phosphodiesterase
MSIVLMNDFHMDDEYTTGANADCDRVTCCRADSGLPKDPTMAAGKWGDATTGRCDVPQRTIVSMLEHIRDEKKPDAVFWMGDSIPHNLDSLSLENNTYIMKAVSQLVDMELIVKGDFGGRFFVTPGNHDDYPQDSFNNFKKRDNPVFNEYAPLWDAFMTDEKQMKTFLDWGYFSQPLKKSDGTKVATVLSINSNVCYLFNFAGWFHFEDPGGMLGWMERTLQEVEAEGGAAILISHVPNYFQCMRQYGKRFHAIVDKYQHVIRFQTNAHEHVEQFQVYRDMVEKKPINVAFWAGSTTTFRGVNPSF